MTRLLPKISLASVSCIALLLAPICAQEKSSIKVCSPKPGEVRALWVVSTTMTSPEKIRTMVEKASVNCFNTLIVQVRGRGDAYYRSRREPRAIELKDQPTDFDPLALTLSEAKQPQVLAGTRAFEICA